MSRNIPFFEFFAELPASPELRLRLAGAELTHGRIDRGDLSIQLDMTVKSPLAPEALHSLEETLKAVYGFQRAELNVTCTAPPPPAPGHAPQGGGPPKAAPKKKAGKILMGNPIKAKPGPMSALNVKMGTATVSGKVFAFECRETRRPGMWRLSFDMTDGTGSVTVQKNLGAKEAQALEAGDFHRFLALVNASGVSSALHLQNTWSTASPKQQAIPLVLAQGAELLEGTGAIRVHGGGFAGTVQAFVPDEKLKAFKAGMETLLGPGKCHVLHIRPQGGCVVAE